MVKETLNNHVVPQLMIRNYMNSFDSNIETFYEYTYKTFNLFRLNSYTFKKVKRGNSSNVLCERGIYDLEMEKQLDRLIENNFGFKLCKDKFVNFENDSDKKLIWDYFWIMNHRSFFGMKMIEFRNGSLNLSDLLNNPRNKSAKDIVTNLFLHSNILGTKFLIPALDTKYQFYKLYFNQPTFLLGDNNTFNLSLGDRELHGFIFDSNNVMVWTNFDYDLELFFHDFCSYFVNIYGVKYVTSCFVDIINLIIYSTSLKILTESEPNEFDEYVKWLVNNLSLFFV